MARVMPRLFNWHIHVPIEDATESAARLLRNNLLSLPSPRMAVSRVFPPQGPHINAPYFSAYFPGALLKPVAALIAAHPGASVMLHPLTGLQFAEHSKPLAQLFGPPMGDVIDYDFLKWHDMARQIIPVPAQL